MVSSFSNPGFPPVDAHPTRLTAMDGRLSAAIDSFEASMRAALRDAIREALDSAFANLTTNFSRDWALLHRDSALRAAGVSDPAETRQQIPIIGKVNFNTISRKNYCFLVELKRSRRWKNHNY
ncbi:hypothetical protein ACFX15_031417 [Malus domestica]|uniref:Uncharacterized protein n=1 Tax=Malus domestica TaxID=3750 RepID=A0A498JYL0_MALDO|nr:hypothetical protein DVH24_001203 [Malus domestica]